MKLRNIKSFFGRNYYNSKGWATNRKIVIIESDDWGSIRMPSKKVYNSLQSNGIKVDKDPFTKFDALASEEDLSALFEILLKHKDKNNNPAVITANTIVANPDFEKIKNSNFEKYFFEPFTLSMQRYAKHTSSINLWKEGIDNNIFHPQLHGREHLNVELWMNHLRANNQEISLAFKHQMFGLSSQLSNTKVSYMAAYDYEIEKSLSFIKKSILDAQKLFIKNFGKNSKSFIAPNYVWSEAIENILSEIDIKYIQSSRYQLLPKFEKKLGKKNKKHFLGETNQNNQTYLVRNCIFEPSLQRPTNPVKETLNQIRTSFFWKKPAIISSHRMNYIGFIDERNRIVNLKYLDSLLKEIIRTWPDVEFMTSDSLGDLIKK